MRSGLTPASINCSSVNCRCVWLAGWSTQVRESATMGDNGGQFQAVHEFDGPFTASLDAECHHPQDWPPAELLLGQIMVLVGRQTG